LVEKRTLVLQTPKDKKLATFARESFAVLCVAFAPGLICISKSTGPLRCLRTKTGEEVWHFTQKDQHFLELAYAEENKVFVGVCWPYERGGSHRLLRFAPQSGDLTEVLDLGPSGEFAFCQRGSRLISSNGSVIDSVTGRTEFTLPFPVRSKRGS